MDTLALVIFATCLLQCLHTGSAVHFPQAFLHIWLPMDFPAGKEVAKIVVLRDQDEMGHNLSYSLRSLENNIEKARKLLSTFSIDALTGVLHTQSSLYHLNPDSRFGLHIIADLKNATSTVHAGINVNITLSKFNLEMCKRSPEFVCFGKNENVTFTIEENMPANQSIGFISQPSFRIFCLSQVNVSYRIENYEYLTRFLDLKPTGELITLTSLDREKTHELTFNVTCDLSDSTAKTSASHNKKVQILVADLNDNGPYFIRGPVTEYFDASALRVGHDLKTYLFVMDPDTTPPQYAVKIVHDPDKSFRLKYTKTFHSEVKEWIIEARLHLMKALPLAGKPYKVIVNFTDLGLPAGNSNRTVMASMILHGRQKEELVEEHFFPLEANLSFTVKVFSSAAIFSRVAHPFQDNVVQNNRLTFWLTNERSENESGLLPFSVTPRTGIIYVNSTNLTALSANVTYFLLKLNWHNSAKDNEGFAWITVHMQRISNINSQEDGNGTVCDNELSMCAIHATEETCVQSCGGGSPNGVCQWRQNSQHSVYSTCTPELSTCPDEICDELESLSFAPSMSICPQDCVDFERVSGFKFSNHSGYGIKGIIMGPCTCDTSGRCECSPHIINDASKKNHKTEENNKSDVSTQTADQYWTSNAQQGTEETIAEQKCGQLCIVVVTLALVVVSLVIFFAVTIFRSRFRLRGWTRGRKYPGSSISLPAVPSDYVDEHSPSVVSNSDTLSTSMSKLLVVDLKWEFPRERLILEQTLGEGEFGRVVKAKALDIIGITGYTTVAVKMLKTGGPNSEQDLISEFNLLKEVSHPNVIRLLGACTSKGGPLYIIVEYAEYGSLRGYLRRSRRLEFRSCTSDDSGVDSIATSTHTHKESSESHLLSEYHLSQRDLISFAWQISKGMAYLSEMKLVHRDLAARNVLVAAGKIVKISDFGLTRDIYIEDAYFKKSLGRVPVKWMAIESLVDNVYTTKSDVWSFGIVLWEIVTLGAGPYPGVPPERLYQLLKNGYRMENPDSSSGELYKIMLKCWTDNPHERPSFAELTKVFDRMLQENVDYLDLTMNVVHNLTYFQEKPRRSEYDGEEVEESEEGEPGYGSWNAFTSDDVDVGLQTCHSLSIANTLSVPETVPSVPSRDSCASDYEDAFLMQPTTCDKNLHDITRNINPRIICDNGNQKCDEHNV